MWRGILHAVVRGKSLPCITLLPTACCILRPRKGGEFFSRVCQATLVRREKDNPPLLGILRILGILGILWFFGGGEVCHTLLVAAELCVLVCGTLLLSPEPVR